MKTEPLFRGKRVDNGEWAEGYYYAIAGYAYITTGSVITGTKAAFSSIRVDPATVEQIAGDVVDENARLRDELERLKDVVCEEDVSSIEEALKEKKLYEDATKTHEDCAQSTNDPSDG